MKALKMLFATKLVALAGFGGFMYANHQAKAQEGEQKAQDAKVDTKSAEKPPDIPEQGLSLSRAAELRNQLLLMRKDVEQKIEKLNVAKQGYERAKGEVEGKLKRIEEERKLLEETLQKERKAKEERLTESLEFIAKMEPKKAAPILESMDRDLAMQLLRKLPPRQVTRLLESVNPKKATELLEYYTRIRSGREYELLREMGLCASGQDEGADGKTINEKSGSTDKAPDSGKNPGVAPEGATGATAAAAATAAPADAKADADPGTKAAKSNEPLATASDATAKEPATGAAPAAATPAVR